jgi:choline dehydrogenase-like flavoprotein
MELQRLMPRNSLLLMIGYVLLNHNGSFPRDYSVPLTYHSACLQIRERVAPEPTTEPPGSASQTYIDNVVRIYQNRSDFTVGNVDPGLPFPPSFGSNIVWRTHSTFHPVTGARRSSDTLLDRDNENLDIRTNALVSKILFDGDAGIPTASRTRATDTPRVRCVRLEPEEVICVKAKGRIYISAGAFHTPALLMKSGIGPNGDKVENDKVRGSWTVCSWTELCVQY